ncbi:MAG: hypothetical protein AVDCRST_MAG79-1862 [uncultured Thermoleophilia bacterium]|uniref:TerB-C domain-containing protein n=1 Tax=uncultured Thermoleophilia bacterium TaxID=1497501 RepID=A0A6J4U4S6_9ACTN|nr:MAG: hypothetical protein AVDCRST_MAG79-1862 [uncultured Thermoleophilia bacterium]
MLGLQPETVYRQLHGLITGDPSTAPDRAAAWRPGGAVRPRPEVPAEPEPVVLDRGRIERTLRETHAVSALLSSIFAEEEGAAPGATGAAAGNGGAPGAVDDGTLPAGLDAPHAALLRSLVGRTVVPRTEFDRAAGDQRLLPDGALDRLNEAAYDVCDAPLLDGDDPLEVDPEVLEELLAP